MNKICIVYSTLPSADEAEKMAKGLVEAKLVACVNIFSDIKSSFLWQGALTCENECVLLAKTLIATKDDVIAWMAKTHPYQVPAILHTEVEANDKFYQFVTKSVG